jgi:hypothetical protein
LLDPSHYEQYAFLKLIYFTGNRTEHNRAIYSPANKGFVRSFKHSTTYKRKQEPCPASQAKWGGWHRPHWRGRHFVHRRYYPYYYGPRCRVIWTYYGPRKICRYRPWLHRHHRWHRRYW